MPARRILIIDDHSFFSFCLRTLIEREIPRTVCHWVSAGAAVREQIRLLQPHLLVIDLSVGPVGGFALAESLRTAGVRTPILFASTSSPLSRSSLARVRGAFVSKSAKPRQLVWRIRRLLKNNPTDDSLPGVCAFA